MENICESRQEIILKKDIQMIDNNSDFEKISNEKRLESIKFSGKVKEIKSQLESKFNLFLEGHLKEVTCVAISSDNKYIISGSNDSTIRI